MANDTFELDEDLVFDGESVFRVGAILKMGKKEKFDKRVHTLPYKFSVDPVRGLKSTSSLHSVFANQPAGVAAANPDVRSSTSVRNAPSSHWHLNIQEAAAIPKLVAEREIYDGDYDFGPLITPRPLESTAGESGLLDECKRERALKSVGQSSRFLQVDFIGRKEYLSTSNWKMSRER